MNFLLLAFNLQDDIYPLGLSYLKSYAQSHHKDINIKIKEFKISSRAGYETNKNAQLAALSYIELTKPDLVAFSCYIWSYNMAKDFATAIKKILPETKILVGGVEVNNTSLSKDIDYVIQGEGEIAFKELLDHLINKKPIEEVHNLISHSHIKNNIKTKLTEISNLDTIPFPYKDLSLKQKYSVIRMETARGCTFSCNFCHYAKPTLRFFSIDYIKDAITFLFQNYNFKYLTFLDANFNTNSKRMFLILNHLKDQIASTGKKPAIHIELRPELVTEEMAKRLKDYNFNINCELGFQSSNDEVLKAANRPTNKNAVINALKYLNKYHLRYKIDLMYGLPSDSFEKFLDSIHFLLTNATKQTQIVAHHYMQLNNTTFANQASLIRLNPNSSSMVIQTNTQTTSDLFLTKLFLKQLNQELNVFNSH